MTKSLGSNEDHLSKDLLISANPKCLHRPMLQW